MNKRTFLKLSTAAVAALLCFGSVNAQASVRRDMDELKHALGWDTIDMKTVETDKAGRPTLERSDTLVNRVERRTSYFSNGAKDTEDVTVIARHSKKTLYSSKKSWNDNGDAVSADVEDDVFSRSGILRRGHNTEMDYQNGRLVGEVVKRYSASAGAWEDTRKQTISYYDDGDMKERVTEYLPSGGKTRESWGIKDGVLGRQETDSAWDVPKGVWD
jgi:hypothetical protein